MKRLKKIVLGGVVVYSLLIGSFVVLLATSDRFLFWLEKAVAIRIEPFDIKAWLWILLGS
jgi:hypothetical protein